MTFQIRKNHGFCFTSTYTFLNVVIIQFPNAMIFKHYYISLKTYRGFIT